MLIYRLICRWSVPTLLTSTAQISVALPTQIFLCSAIFTYHILEYPLNFTVCGSVLWFINIGLTSVRLHAICLPMHKVAKCLDSLSSLFNILSNRPLQRLHQKELKPMFNQYMTVHNDWPISDRNWAISSYKCVIDTHIILVRVVRSILVLNTPLKTNIFHLLWQY
jgi:hypothetical protein